MGLRPRKVNNSKYRVEVRISGLSDRVKMNEKGGV